MRLPEYERIDLLVSLLEDGNGAAFARKIGCDKSRITEMRKGKRGTEGYRERIAEAYPILKGSRFLDTGEIGDFPLVALVSFLVKQNKKILSKM